RRRAAPGGPGRASLPLGRVPGSYPPGPGSTPDELVDLLEEGWRAAHEQRGDAALAPGLEVVADLLGRPDEVDVLHHRGGDERGRLVLAAVEVGLLDGLALRLVAEAGEHVLVEVPVPGPHPAHVEGQGGPQEVGA